MPRNIRFSIWFSLILLAAFAVGYSAWAKATLNWPFDKTFYPYPEIHKNNTPQPPLSLRGGEGELNIASWKTYRNDEYGFEFKYPKDLTFEEAKSKTFNNRENLKITFHRSDIQSGFLIEMNLEAIGIENCDMPTKQIKYINGIKMIQEECGGIITYDFSQNGNSFFAFLNSDQYDTNVFNQILSTFKFIK